MYRAQFPSLLPLSRLHLAAHCHPQAPSAKEWTPPFNVRRDEAGLEFQLGLPGVANDQLDIEIKDEQLVVSVKVPTTTESEESNGQWLRREWLPTNQVRRFDLPDNVDATAITAKMTNGLLSLRLPFHKESRPRKVDIAA